MRKLLHLVALAVSFACAGVVHAQSLAISSAPSMPGTPGDGIRLGERWVLHLGLGVGLRYDSNVFYTTSGETAALALQIQPQFSIGTRAKGNSKLSFNFTGALDYREFLVSSTGVKPERQLNVTGGVSMGIAPSPSFGIDLFDNVSRSSQPAYVATSHNYNRDVNELGFRLRIKPGGGRLEAQAGYTFGVDFWEQSAQALYNDYYHRAFVRLLYKFLPKTSVYVQAEDTAYQYTDHHDATDNAIRPTGYPLSVIAGLNGLLTPKLTFDIYGGYQNGFYPGKVNANTGTAGLTLSWRPYALGSGNLAYRHDIENSLLGVYANYDYVSASWAQQIWRFLASLRLGYQNTRYQGISPETGVVSSSGVASSTRTDNSFTLNARVDYYAYRNWLALSLGYDFTLLRSDESLAQTAVVTGATIPVSFNKSEVYLTLSLLY